MPAVIRLKRISCNKKPAYRVVATSKEAPRDGKFIEELGYYQPKHNPPKFEVDRDRVKYWLSQGTELSETLRSVFKKNGLLNTTK